MKYHKPIQLTNDITPETTSDIIFGLHAQDKSLPSHQPILLLINSRGGDVYSGLAIIDTIETIKDSRPVHTHILGRAMSMSALIAITGTYRTISNHGMILLHKPSSIGLPSFLSEYETDTFKVYLKLVRHLQRHSKMDDLPTYDLLLDAPESLKNGLIDEITNSPLSHIEGYTL